jgi:glycosyltransferase
MKVSVITVVFNGAKTIRTCIESVLAQEYPNIEYIIVDGASKDTTVEIARSYGDKITKIISEPDKGIYDAMNKGIRNATGDIVVLLNCDDLYVDSHVIADVVKEFEKNPEIGCVYGDLEYVDQHNTDIVRRYWKSRAYKPGLFRTGWHPAHPTFFVKKNIYDMYGLFNLAFPISADYELMLRFLEIHRVPSGYVPRVLVKMRLGGNSNKSLEHIIKGNIEVLKAWKANNVSTPWWIFFSKPLSKLFQLK